GCRSHSCGFPLPVLNRRGSGDGPTNRHPYGEDDYAAAGADFSPVIRTNFGSSASGRRRYRVKRKLSPARTTLWVVVTWANAGPNPATCGVKATWWVPKSK